MYGKKRDMRAVFTDRLGRLVNYWILTYRQPHRITSDSRANHTFKILLHQFKTQVTKSQVSLAGFASVCLSLSLFSPPLSLSFSSPIPSPQSPPTLHARTQHTHARTHARTHAHTHTHTHARIHPHAETLSCLVSRCHWLCACCFSRACMCVRERERESVCQRVCV